MFDYIYSFHRSDFPVQHFFVVVILGLDELVAKLEPPSKSLNGHFAEEHYNPSHKCLESPKPRDTVTEPTLG